MERNVVPHGRLGDLESDHAVRIRACGLGLYGVAGGEFFDAIVYGRQFAVEMIGGAGPWDGDEGLVEVGNANLAIEIADDAREVDEA